MNSIRFEASHIMLSEAQSNEIYMTVLMRMFSTRPNRNGFAVSEAFMDNIIANHSKYTCLPLCADANRLRHGEGRKLTHMLEGDEFKSEQIGSFFSFAKANDEFGISLIGEARIPKRNPVLCETIRRLYKEGALAFSFEIVAGTITDMNGVQMIDAAEDNELIGMAIVSVPAYPEATALTLVAEQKEHKEDERMDETMKKLAETEARLKLAEEKSSETEEELKKKDESLNESEANRKRCEADLEAAHTRISELEKQVEELTPYKAEAEALKAEKAAAELMAKQTELTTFAEAQGLDVNSEAVASAIKELNYAALIAEANKNSGKDAPRKTVAGYAVTVGLHAQGDYGDLLDRAN